MDYNEFAESIKAKYPEYADMDNRELAEKMVAKYPEYNDVTFDTPRSKSEPLRPSSFQKKSLKEQSKMSPSEWSNYKLDERANYEQKHPILSGINKEFNPTYRADKLGWENMAETNKPYPDFATTLKQDLSALAPAINTATAIGTGSANGIKGLMGAGALQGGVSGAVNDIADNGLSLQTPLNTLGGATVGGTIGGLAGGLPWLGNKATNWLAPRVGASLGGVTVDTINQAIKPFSRAVDMTADKAKALLLDTTSNVRNAYNNLVNKAGQNVKDAVHGLRDNQYRVPKQELFNDVGSTFDQYQGDYINPARNMTGGLENGLYNLIDQGADDAVSQLRNEFNSNKGINYTVNNKLNEAYDILSTATGKSVNWLKSRLFDPKNKGVIQQSENIGKLLENLGEISEANTGNLSGKAYNYYEPVMNADSDMAQNIIDKAYNDIINNNFSNNLDPLGNALNSAEQDYRVAINNLLDNYKNQDLYNTTIDKFFENSSVKNLPEEIQTEYAQRMMNDIDKIYNETNTISPMDLEKAKQQIGSMVNWNDETAKNFKNPILEQIYGKFNNRLSELDPNLAQANEIYGNLMNYKKNEGLRSVLRSGDSIDSASQTLKNYKSTVTKGNTGRNIQDLEDTLVKNGAEPFLDTIDDINAAMDLENSLKTGRNFLGATDLAKQVLLRPTLRGIRNFNNFKANLPLKHPVLDKTLQGVNNIKTGVGNYIRPLLYRGVPFTGYVSNEPYVKNIQFNEDGTIKEEY